MLQFYVNMLLLFTSLDYYKGRPKFKADCSIESRPGVWIFSTKPKWSQWTLIARSNWKGMTYPHMCISECVPGRVKEPLFSCFQN